MNERRFPSREKRKANLLKMIQAKPEWAADRILDLQDGLQSHEGSLLEERRTNKRLNEMIEGLKSGSCSHPDAVCDCWFDSLCWPDESSVDRADIRGKHNFNCRRR